jgi:predicted XRE-type DNA-binding protein
MRSAVNKPAHITRGNVMDDLGLAPENATALKFKAELYRAILKSSRKYSQKDLQAILGEPQPRVSELLNGKIANKSVDKLLQYAGRLGIEVKGKFAETRNKGEGIPQRGRSSGVVGLGKFRSGIPDLGSAKQRLGKFGRKG